MDTRGLQHAFVLGQHDEAQNFVRLFFLSVHLMTPPPPLLARPRSPLPEDNSFRSLSVAIQLFPGISAISLLLSSSVSQAALFNNALERLSLSASYICIVTSLYCYILALSLVEFSSASKALTQGASDGIQLLRHFQFASQRPKRCKNSLSTT